MKYLNLYENFDFEEDFEEDEPMDRNWNIERLRYLRVMTGKSRMSDKPMTLKIQNKYGMRDKGAVSVFEVIDRILNGFIEMDNNTIGWLNEINSIVNIDNIKKLKFYDIHGFPPTDNYKIDNYTTALKREGRISNEESFKYYYKRDFMKNLYESINFDEFDIEDDDPDELKVGDTILCKKSGGYSMGDFRKGNEYKIVDIYSDFLKLSSGHHILYKNYQDHTNSNRWLFYKYFDKKVNENINFDEFDIEEDEPTKFKEIIKTKSNDNFYDFLLFHDLLEDYIRDFNDTSKVIDRGNTMEELENELESFFGRRSKDYIRHGIRTKQKEWLNNDKKWLSDLRSQGK